MNSITPHHDEKNILELNFHDDGRIRLSIYESHGEGPIAFYQETEVAIEQIDGLVREITHYLNKINIFKELDQRLLGELRSSCQLLYNELLSQEIKVRLQNASSKNLELILDEQLVHIPWELLFDGERFLCEQLNIGRLVRTKGSGLNQQRQPPEPKTELNMLIIADPTEDLEVAWQEGVKIYEAFQRLEDIVKITLQTADQVDRDTLKKCLWDYDLIHYAGHADYDPSRPGQSGWMLSDGKLRASDILKMAGGKKRMPGLVFGNACQSGYTEKWARKKDTFEYNHLSYGLVHSFLMAGVQYYIGTFCDVSDKYGALMGIEFYHYLLEGKSIGESLRKARESFQEKYGKESTAWINYVLYGHPGDCLIRLKGKDAQCIGHDEQRIHKTGPVKHALTDSQTGYKSKIHSIRRSFLSNPQRDKWIRPAILFIILLTMILMFILLPRKISINMPAKDAQKGVTVQNKKERIDELKRMIYEKLKTREELVPPVKTPDMPSDGWTYKPVSLAIFNISDKNGGSFPEWAIILLRETEKRLNQCFIEDLRIKVVEREELDMILEEKDLALSDFSFKDYRELFGRFLYARVMLFIEIFNSSEGISLCYKVVNSDTGEIDKISSDLVLTKRENSGHLTEAICLPVKKTIYANYPLRGRIASVENNMIFLNIGMETGVKAGDIFIVYESYNTGIMRKNVGKIRVIDEVTGNAQCEVLEGKGFMNGLPVELIDL